MKVYPFKIPKPNNNAIVYQEDIESIFYNELHQHDEIQISFLSKGNGTLLLGNSFTNYYTGDIFVIGSNVPHAFKSDASSDEKSVMLSLFFTKDAFGNAFFDLPEFVELSSFFVNAQQGFQLQSHQEEIKKWFYQLKNASQFEQFLGLISILKTISISEKKLLSDQTNLRQYTDNEGKRMRTVLAYTLENSDKTITLNEIANVANMTKNAFCKFFKKRTNKTYIQFLTELRIENACKFLQSDKDASVAEIAFKTGFGTIANFNRRFKELKNTTPLTFKKL